MSFMHQIHEAQDADYEKSEIVKCFQSMISILTLRNVLESTPNLSLNQLLQYLETHFDEQNATDLCSELTSMGQLMEESAYQYVMRCIKIT